MLHAWVCAQPVDTSTQSKPSLLNQLLFCTPSTPSTPFHTSAGAAAAGAGTAQGGAEGSGCSSGCSRQVEGPFWATAWSVAATALAGGWGRTMFGKCGECGNCGNNRQKRKVKPSPQLPCRVFSVRRGRGVTHTCSSVPHFFLHLLCSHTLCCLPLQHCPDITDESVAEAVTLCPTLVVLQLTSCRNITCQVC